MLTTARQIGGIVSYAPGPVYQKGLTWPRFALSKGFDTGL